MALHNRAIRVDLKVGSGGLHKVSVTTPDVRADREEQSVFSSSAQELFRQDLHLKPYPTKQQRRFVCIGAIQPR